jgi:acyl carrier protein
MEHTEIIAKLATIVRKVTKSKIEIREETRLIEDLGVDSLDLLEIVMAVEDMFRIKITDQDFSHLATVSAAVSYIQDKIPL